MKVTVDRVAEGFQAPAAADDDSSDGHQGIGRVKFVCELEGHDKASFSKLGEGLAVLEAEGIGEIFYRSAGDSL